MQWLLIGSKCDWEKKRVVESNSGEQLAQSQGIPFLETSAKTNHNIDEVRGHLKCHYDVITRVLFLQAFEQLVGLMQAVS